ncbi:MAG: anti-sigma F factor [Clostridia bacterium]|nr:anti-sigma F factor [Clostridia bacterium]
MKYINQMTLKFDAISANEGFARSTVAGFCVLLNPTLDELTDIKTAVSEAVTNCVVHAYPNKLGTIEIWVGLTQNSVNIAVRDEGVGIDDLEKAREPFYSSKPNEERSGLGFTVMESFMDTLELNQREKGGLEVVMSKKIKSQKEARGSINAIL